MRLSEEQLRVVNSDSKRLVVQAGAGSGKTHVLVQRYLRHVIKDGLRPDQILSVTFTRRAADEMRERIIRELLSQGLPDAAQIAETGPIQTFDSFFDRMLRENCLEAGLDPHFEQMTGTEASILLNEYFDEELTSSTDDDPYLKALRNEYVGKRAFGGAPGLDGTLRNAIRESSHKLRASLHSPHDLLEHYASVDSLVAHLKQMHRNGLVPQDVKWPAFLEDSFTEALPEIEIEQLTLVCGFMQLLVRCWLRLEHEMGRQQRFDHARIESLFRLLVENNPAVCERLRRQIKVALVDEAQDINPVQYRVLEQIGFETEMLVGDPQQCIYAFRSASPKRFIEYRDRSDSLSLSANYRSASEVLKFVDGVFAPKWGENYQAGVAQIQETEGARELWAQPEVDSQLTAQWIKELCDVHGAHNIVALTPFRVGYENLVNALKRLGIEAIQVGRQDFFTQLQIHDLANALEALANPHRDFPLLCLLHSPLVGLSLDEVMTLALDAKEQDTSVFELLKQREVPAIQHFMEFFEPLTRIADRLAGWEAISEFLNRSPFLKTLAEGANAHQALANIRKLHLSAMSQSGQSATALAEYMRTVQLLKHKEEFAKISEAGEPVIQIINVHQVKGLEFPVVVLPDTGRKPPRRNPTVTDAESGLVALSTAIKSKFYMALADALVKREIEESERTLYVAMTRAQHTLAVVAYPRKGLWGTEISKMLNFNGVEHPEIRVRRFEE